MNRSGHSVAMVVAIIVAADLMLLLLTVPRTWALAATLFVTLGGILGLAVRTGRRVRRLQGPTTLRRMG